MKIRSDLETARDILEANCYCVIAAASLDGRPWAAPVFFNYDKRLRIYWESARDCLHSELIAENPRVAIVVADYDAVSGVYIDAQACEVSRDKLTAAVAAFLDGPHEKSENKGRTAEDYGADRPLRLYVAEPEQFYLLKRGVPKDGYHVDERIALNLLEGA